MEKRHLELKECINYLLTTAQHNVFQEMSRRLEPFDVTPIQYAVLHCLWVSETDTPKDIAAELKVENSTISGILDRMEKKSLIRRRINTKDRRYIEIALTEKGRKLKEPVLDAVDQANKEILAVLSENDIKVLRKSLKALAEI